MRRRQYPWLVVSALIGIFCVAGCGQPAQPRFTSVHVWRTSAFPNNHIPPFDKTVTDAAKAQQLYATLWSVRELPNGTYVCPSESDVLYHVTFFVANVGFADATVNPDDCGTVTFRGGHGGSWMTDGTFWQQVAGALGVPEPTLYPVTPQSSGPSAPTPVP